MADIRKLVKGDTDSPDRLKASIPTLVDACPTISDLLSGIAESKGLEAVPKHSITFYLDIAGLNASISTKGGEVTLFAKISDPLTPWMCLERALNQGEFATKKNAERRASY